MMANNCEMPYHVGAFSRTVVRFPGFLSPFSLPMGLCLCCHFGRINTFPICFTVASGLVMLVCFVVSAGISFVAISNGAFDTLGAWSDLSSIIVQQNRGFEVARTMGWQLLLEKYAKVRFECAEIINACRLFTFEHHFRHHFPSPPIEDRRELLNSKGAPLENRWNSSS